MDTETKNNFEKELRSFFGLTLLNIVAAALALAMGIALTVTQLLGMVHAGQLEVIPLFLVPLGAAVFVCGMFWLVKISELMGEVGDIRRAYEELDVKDDDRVTGLMIKMTALYRGNRPLVERMRQFGMLSGAIFMAIGVLSIINVEVSAGLQWLSLFQLVGASIPIIMGAVGLLVAHYFSLYSEAWDARMEKTERIEDALRQKLEGK